MDIIYIRSLSIDTVVGLYDWERKIKHNLIFDLDIACDILAASASDDIKDTLDYKAISKSLMVFVQNSRFKLIESLAEASAQHLLLEFSIPWVRLSLTKAGALKDTSVGIVIERGIRPG